MTLYINYIENIYFNRKIIDMSNSIKNSYIPKDKTTGYCDSSYLAEFEQGNFVHAAMQTRYTGQELLKIFLHNEHVSDEEKIKQLRYIIQRIRYIASDINQEYDNYIIQNNNEVRGNLKTAYQEYLKKGERISWMDFNNTSRWKSE